MPRYFFNVLDYPDRVPDIEGSDMPDPEAARRYAIEAARELVSERAKKGELPLSYILTVTDDAGSVVLSISFREALTIV